jgi:selenoprotein W-related protein
LAGEIIEEYGNDLESIQLVRGSKGQFEVTVDGQSVYSKKETMRHANPGEVVENIRRIRGVNSPHTDAGSSLHL